MQWKLSDNDGNLVGSCLTCVEGFVLQNRPCQCTSCWNYLPETAFEEKQRKWQSTCKRVCFHCVEKRKCKVCETWKPISAYTDNEWHHAAWKESAQGKCTACVNLHQRYWYCKMCKAKKKGVRVQHVANETWCTYLQWA